MISKSNDGSRVHHSRRSGLDTLNKSMSGRSTKLLWIIALLLCAPLAHAQIYRCIGVHGEPVFSGEACAPGASPRSAGDIAARSGGFTAACATSPGKLRKATAEAFDTHDANRLAGLIVWRGVDQTLAQATLRAFTVWVQQPLAGIALAYANGPPDAHAGAVSGGHAADATGPASGQLSSIEISTGGDDGSTRDFGVLRFGGCWWLTF
jgi:hypothetical protein